MARQDGITRAALNEAPANRAERRAAARVAGRSRQQIQPLTRAELLALPAAVPLWPTAGRAVSLGRTKTFELARAGEFPVPVLRLGASYRVRTADLLAYLGIEPAA